MFYDKLVELCREKGVSPSKACEDMGLSNATATRWKKSKSEPQNKTLQVIANYFNVSIQELISDKKTPATKSDEQVEDIDNEIMFYARQLSPERKKFLLDQIRASAQSQE